MSNEQKEDVRLSGNSDFIKCLVPKKAEEGIEIIKKTADKIKEKAKKAGCYGMVHVGNYIRMGEPVKSYTRSCGRH